MKYFNLLRLALLCTLFFLNTAASAQKRQSNGFLITGHLKDAKNGTMVKLQDIDAQRFIDSTTTVNGHFTLKGHVDQPTACWLSCAQEYATLQVENVAMTFNSPLKDMKLNFKATGGREQQLQNQLDFLQRPFERKYMATYIALNAKNYANEEERKALTAEFNTAQQTYMDIYINFGKVNINSYLGLDIVYRNRKKIAKDSITILIKDLPLNLKKTAKASALLLYTRQDLVQKGGQYLDFKVKTIKGEDFKLSDLKGKYIYLTFGSFACGPCRTENREISQQYESISKRFQVVNFSLDVNRKEWEAAAEADHLVWPNVSDMAGMAGKIKTLYGVQSMPTSFLIAPNGVVLEKFEGYNPENLARIEKLIDQHKN